MITYILVTWCLCGFGTTSDPRIDPMTYEDCVVRREIVIEYGEIDGAECVLTNMEAGS